MKNHSATTISDLNFSDPNHEDEAKIHRQPQQIQILQPAKQITTIPNKVSRNLHLQSNEKENSRTSLCWHSGSTKEKVITEVGVEDDASVTGTGEVTDAPNLMVMVIPTPRSNNSGIGVAAETKEDKSESSGITDDVFALVTEDAQGAPKPANPHKNPLSCGRRLHLRPLFMAKPPPLMAAVFPWDHKREAVTLNTQGRSPTNDDLRLAKGCLGAAKKLLEEEIVSSETGPKAARSRALKEMDGYTIFSFWFLDSLRKTKHEKLP